MKDVFKQFRPSSWAIDNRTSIYVVTVLITLIGLVSYINLPKESFPEITIPKIFVNTIYPGTSPTNMENLVTRPIEKQMKGISGVKKVTSQSLQDYSVITIEFNTDVDIAVAKQKVKDAVDKAKPDLPTDLPADPNVMDVNLSELPILYVNVSPKTQMDIIKLNDIAENLQDRIEGLKQVSKVDLICAPVREIQVNVDMYALQARQLTMDDIDRAIAFENRTISAGTVPMEGMRR